MKRVVLIVMLLITVIGGGVLDVLIGPIYGLIFSIFGLILISGIYTYLDYYGGNKK